MAAKFRFRLQPVLDQRERVEQAKQLRVAELERERIVVEEKLRRCQSDIQDAKLDLRMRLGGGGSGNRVSRPLSRFGYNTGFVVLRCWHVARSV